MGTMVDLSFGLSPRPVVVKRRDIVTGIPVVRVSPLGRKGLNLPPKWNDEHPIHPHPDEPVPRERGACLRLRILERLSPLPTGGAP